MYYLYETHCHGSQCSACAKSLSQDMVYAYQKAGYAGMVLTDHFIYGNTAVSRSLPWEQRMQAYYDAFLDAKAVGDALDFDVIFGFEHWYGSGKEMLVYGIDLDFLLEHPEIPQLSIDAFAELVHQGGGLLIQAHPYRERYYISGDVPIRPDLVDGIEVYNAWNGPGENAKALALEQTGEFIYTGGGDTHADWDKMVGAAGILLPHRVKTTQEFAKVLREKKHGFRLNFQNEREVSEENII